MFWNKKPKPIESKVESEFDTNFKHVTFSHASARHSPHIIVNEYSRLIRDANIMLNHVNKVNELEITNWGSGIDMKVKYPERMGLKNRTIFKDRRSITLDNEFLINYVKTINPEDMTEVVRLKSEIKMLELEKDKFKLKYE